VVIGFEQVLYAKSDRTYVTFHLANGKKHITTQSLQYYQSLLPENILFRVHISYLVNIKHIKGLSSWRGGLITLKGGSEIPITYRRKAAFSKILEGQDRQ